MVRLPPKHNLLITACLLFFCALSTIGSIVSPMATLVAVVLVLAGGVILVFPAVGLSLMAAFFLIQGSPIYTAYGILAKSVSASDLVGVLVLVGWVFHSLRESKFTPAVQGNLSWRVFLVVSAYFGWDVFSSFWSPASLAILTDGLRHDIEHLCFFGLVLLILTDRRQVKVAAAFYAAVGSLLAVYTLATFHAQLAADAYSAYRGGLPSTLDANQLSTILVVVPAFAFLATRDQSRRLRLAVMSVLLPLTTVTLIILTSREVLGAAALAVFAIPLLTRGAGSRFSLLPVILLCGLTFAALVYTNSVPSYVQTRFHATQSDQLGARLPLWREGLQQFANHPIVGLGSKGLETRLVATHVSDQTSVHEEYIRSLANNGLIGFALLVLMLATVGRAAIWGAGRNPASIAIGVVVLVSLASADFLQTHWMWVILSLATVYGLRAGGEQDTHSAEQGNPRTDQSLRLGLARDHATAAW